MTHRVLHFGCAALAVGLALACSSTSTQQSDKAVIFTGLPPSDELRARLVLDGEWGDSGYDFVFHGGQQHEVSVVKLTGEWNAKTKAFKVRRRTEAVETKLSGDDLWGLNELLRYYREGPPDDCSDTHIITLERMRGGKAIATEKFVDESCGPEGVKGVVTLWDVVHRVDFPK